MKSLRQLLPFVILVSNVSAPPGIKWQNTIGGSSTDWLNSIQQTSDGGYILGGYSHSNISGDKSENSMGTRDYWVVKLDSTGIIEWQNTIGGSGSEVLFSIQQTREDSYILGGVSDSDSSVDKTENGFGGYDYWVVKIDSIGDIEWQNTIGGSADEYLRCIQLTADGGCILAGDSKSNISGDKAENSKGGFDYWIVKLDSAGNIQWQKTIGGQFHDALSSIQQASDGSYICGGSSTSGISGDKTEENFGDTDYWVVKLDPYGNIQWQKTIGGGNIDGVSSIRQTDDGGYICAGLSLSGRTGNKTVGSKGSIDYWLVKLDTSGNIEWQKAIGGNNSDELYSMELTTDGGYICGGRSASGISGDKTEISRGSFDYWIVKTDAFGNIQWQKTIGGNGFDELYSIQQT